MYLGIILGVSVDKDNKFFEYFIQKELGAIKSQNKDQDVQSGYSNQTSEWILTFGLRRLQFMTSRSFPSALHTKIHFKIVLNEKVSSGCKDKNATKKD